MTLLARLNGLSPLRYLELPGDVKHICLIIAQKYLPHMEEVMSSLQGVSLEHIVLTDFEPIQGGDYTFAHNGTLSTVPVGSIGDLLRLPHLERVYFARPDDPTCEELTQLSRILAPHGVTSFYLFLARPFRYVSVKYAPSLYKSNAPLLEKIYASLADELSQEAYATRIKAILTGNGGYLAVSGHPEYYHPLVRPEKGDVMIDGGVSDMVNVQKMFAESVGEEGALYGFEPIPDMYESALSSLGQYPHYHLNCKGLGEMNGQLHFKMLRDSSHVSQKADEHTVTCEVTSIDAFVAEKQISKLDCIKLDIEGSELAALQGAKESILKYRPKLIICLYHKVEDMVTIPLFVKKLVPEYELFVSNSSIHFLDTILYARIP